MNKINKQEFENAVKGMELPDNLEMAAFEVCVNKRPSASARKRYRIMGIDSLLRTVHRVEGEVLRARSEARARGSSC